MVPVRYSGKLAKTALAYSRFGLTSEQYTVAMPEEGALLRFSDLECQSSHYLLTFKELNSSFAETFKVGTYGQISF